jgi:hypothetical protein
MKFLQKPFTLQVKHGLKDDLDDLFVKSTAVKGELYYATDTKELFIASHDGGHDDFEFVLVTIDSSSLTITESQISDLKAYALDSDLNTHIEDTTNPHSVTKTQVGLSNVPNLDTTEAVNNEHVQGTDTTLDSGGDNEITASTIKTHVESEANPHSVTKTQIGLGDVTNDAQLKREAGDINTFTEKAEPHEDDVVLIEDSEDSFAKKKVKVEAFLSGSTPAVPPVVNTVEVSGNFTLDGPNGTFYYYPATGSDISAIDMLIDNSAPVGTYYYFQSPAIDSGSTIKINQSETFIILPFFNELIDGELGVVDSWGAYNLAFKAVKVSSTTWAIQEPLGYITPIEEVI